MPWDTSALRTISGRAASGKLRFGKDTFNAALDDGGNQFYGLLDDVAIFKTALPQSRIADLAAADHLSGAEKDLYAGFTFGYVPAGGLPSTLNHSLTHSPSASVRTVSANRDNAADAKLLPLALTAHRHLPFPEGQVVNVIQGYDDAGGSHKGYASFCWDFDLAIGQPQSNGVPFYAAGPGTVDFVKQDSSTSASANFISVKLGEHEVCDYLHLGQNTAKVKVGDQVSFGQQLATIGDTGVKPGAYHLHLATTNLGEGKKSSGGAFVTIPAPLANYEASDDQGSTWHHVSRGIPTKGQWLRRVAPASPVRYTAVWSPSTEGEVQV